jgi:hypothetical protein
VIGHRRRSLALYLPASLRKREQEEEIHRGLNNHSGPSRENKLRRPYVNMHFPTDRVAMPDSKFKMEHRIERENFMYQHDALQLPPENGRPIGYVLIQGHNHDVSASPRRVVATV